MRLAFDVEGNPIPTTKLHCICIKDVDKNEKVLRFHDDESLYADGTMAEGIAMLVKADMVIAHNYIGYDGPTLEELAGFTHTNPYDTLVVARLIFPWIGVIDKRRKNFPSELNGKHSLKAWGERLGEKKQEAPSVEDNPEWWSKLSLEMLDYCAQDVTLLTRLFHYFESQKWPQESTDLEHSFAACVKRQEDNGVCFDMDSAEDLVKGWQVRRAELNSELGKQLGSYTKEWVTKVRKEKRSKEVPYDPSSRYQVAKALIHKFGWQPTSFTDGGRPQLNEDSIALMDRAKIPFKDLLLEWFTISHRLGQAAEGEHSWLNYAAKEGRSYRIHGRVNHNGARTGRCTHSRPNMNVPRVTSLFGYECRALFTPRPGWKMVGADLSGIEARILGHYLHPYDGGKYIERVLAGQIHDDNQRILKFKKRDSAKTVLYAVMYGSQAKGLSVSIASCEDRPCSEQEGAKVRKTLLDSMPGMETLIEQVYLAMKENGYLVGLDGRRLKPRKKSATLNCLFQSGGALVMKWATVIQHTLLDMTIGPDNWAPMLHVHDEAQVECKPEYVDQVSRITLKAMRLAGEKLKLHIPIEGEAKVGNNWAETH